MIMKLVQAAVLVTSALALGGCPFGGAKTAAPAKKAPAADYQAAVPPSPPAAQIRSICYTEADLGTIRARMLQQEMSVVALQCQNASGGRAYEPQYASFLQKYQSDLATNARSLQELARRKRLQRRCRGHRVRKSHGPEGTGRQGILQAAACVPSNGRSIPRPPRLPRSRRRTISARI
jgi:hypothetical protein